MSIDKNTLLVHVESGTYPLTIASLKHRHPNVSFAAEVPVAEVEAMGYAVVKRAERPEGDVVTEVAPALVEGEGYVQTFKVREFNDEELTARLENKKHLVASDINAARERTLADGAAIDFGGDVGVLHVQMRDGDRANILGLQQGAQRAKAAGIVDAVLPLRTAEDVSVYLTPDQMIAAAWLVFDSYQEVMAASWVAKDALAAITAPGAEVPEAPATFAPAVKVLG